MKILSAGYIKQPIPLDGYLVNWLGKSVIGEDWFGRDIGIKRVRQHVIYGASTEINLIKNLGSTTVLKRAGR